MRRCRLGGLRRDEEGRPLGPYEVRDLISPDPSDPARYSLRCFRSSGLQSFAFSLGFDFAEYERNRVRCRVYLGRYARYQPSEIDRMLVREVREHMRELSELIRHESRATGVTDSG